MMSKQQVASRRQLVANHQNCVSIRSILQYYFGMKIIFPRIASLVLVGFALTVAIAAQSREITAAEFHSMRNKAELATGMTYPRIETLVRGENSKYGSTTVSTYEKHGRSYQKITGRTDAGTIVRESIWFDGEYFSRINGGVWSAPKVDGIGGGVGMGIGTACECTLEVVKEGNDSFTMLSKTVTNSLGDRMVWRGKIDSVGRLVEISENGVGGDKTKKVEFPDKIFPIKKPRVGTKDNVRYRSESPTRGSSPVPPISTKPK